MLIFFLSLFGLAIGSFISCLVYRISPRGCADAHPRGVWGRSFCDHCKKKLAWYDNIPLISFLWLGGKSRCCHFPIPYQYPLAELTTGLMTVVIVPYDILIYHIPWWGAGYALLMVYALMAIFLSDLNYGVIPDQIIYPAILLALIYDFLVYEVSLGYLFSAIIAGLLFLFLHLITKGKGMGFGDVKLAFLMGLFLGFPKIVVALYFAFLTGAAVGVILIMLGKKKLKSAIPFGPFLVAGTVFALFWGEQIINKFIGS